MKALAEIAQTLSFGAEKYETHNWRDGFIWSRLEDAMLRHYAAYQNGEDIDKESGISHLAHMCFCALVLLEHQLSDMGTDDRHTKKTDIDFECRYKKPKNQMTQGINQKVRQLQMFRSKSPTKSDIAGENND